MHVDIRGSRKGRRLGRDMDMPKVGGGVAFTSEDATTLVVNVDMGAREDCFTPSIAQLGNGQE